MITNDEIKSKLDKNSKIYMIQNNINYINNVQNINKY